MYIGAPSSSYYSRTLAATGTTYSHEVAISFARHQEERLNYEARKPSCSPSSGTKAFTSSYCQPAPSAI
ncbi:hypothetical protein BHE74_00020610 [Ensete ventricosum]|nr:hypothetical protein BHE74_00020610 [Ensete ventricosum]